MPAYHPSFFIHSETWTAAISGRNSVLQHKINCFYQYCSPQVHSPFAAGSHTTILLMYLIFPHMWPRMQNTKGNQILELQMRTIKQGFNRPRGCVETSYCRNLHKENRNDLSYSERTSVPSFALNQTLTILFHKLLYFRYLSEMQSSTLNYFKITNFAFQILSILWTPVCMGLYFR